MEKVNGIGGVFFVAKKPEGLSRWYKQYLGVDCAPPTYDTAPWRQDAGPAVFAPLPESTTYFGDARRTWIINFRVSDLEAMAAQLSAAGIKVDVDPDAVHWLDRTGFQRKNPTAGQQNWRPFSGPPL